MQHVTEKDTVTITYEGRLPDGSVFESTKDCGPLSFKLGTDAVLPSFEKAVIGMAVQETKTIILPPDDAFGTRREDLVLEVPRINFGDLDLQPGITVGMNMTHEGTTQKLPATIVEISDSTVSVDFNHPLAGHELCYTITLQSIEAGNTGCNNEEGSSCSASSGKRCSC